MVSLVGMVLQLKQVAETSPVICPIYPIMQIIDGGKISWFKTELCFAGKHLWLYDSLTWPDPIMSHKGFSLFNWKSYVVSNQSENYNIQ